MWFNSSQFTAIYKHPLLWIQKSRWRSRTRSSSSGVKSKGHGVETTQCVLVWISLFVALCSTVSYGLGVRVRLIKDVGSGPAPLPRLLVLHQSLSQTRSSLYLLKNEYVISTKEGLHSMDCFKLRMYNYFGFRCMLCTSYITSRLISQCV